MPAKWVLTSWWIFDEKYFFLPCFMHSQSQLKDVKGFESGTNFGGKCIYAYMIYISDFPMQIVNTSAN